MTKAKITGSAPILLVSDVVASANYYRDRLGFSYDEFWGDPPAFCILRRNDFHVMLARAKGPKYIVPHEDVRPDMWDIYFWVDDADALHEELKERGATLHYGLRDQPYGCREFAVKDLDGYAIAFGQNVG